MDQTEKGAGTEMSEIKELGETAYAGYLKASGGKSLITGDPLPAWDDVLPGIRQAWNLGAMAVVDAWRTAGDEPIGPAGIDRLCRVAEGFEARYREYSDAANTETDLDHSRAQRAIGVAFKKCAGQLRDVIGDLASPAAEDFDRAAEEIAKPPARYALVEQMGHRATYAAIRETTFLGEPVLEVTALNDGSVHLVSPKSIFEVTLMPEDQARNLAARTTSWTAVAIPAAHYGGSDFDTWSDRDDDGERDTARRMDALDHAARLEDALSGDGTCPDCGMRHKHADDDQ